jgi:hypothetical protein
MYFKGNVERKDGGGELGWVRRANHSLGANVAMIDNAAP